MAFGTTEETLRTAFSQYGTVTKVQLIMDRETGRPRGFAFVEMSDGGDQAIAATNGMQLDGRALTVNEAKPREDRGWGGGGWGGGGGGGGGGGPRGGGEVVGGVVVGGTVGGRGSGGGAGVVAVIEALGSVRPLTGGAVSGLVGFPRLPARCRPGGRVGRLPGLL